MCTPEVRKEANRRFWLVKGHLIPKTENDNTVVGYYESYFRRLWFEGSDGAPLYKYEEGFEDAYAVREAEVLSDELNSVAVLGYD